MNAPASTLDVGERERSFGIDELFFSTTDHRGVITAGNEVFVRISGYDADELIGRPHNLIRHPGMPKAVFRLLWGHLEAGQPIMAYVKNRAKDGSHYWVAAVARPVDGGHLSVRLKPSTEIFDLVRSLYIRMNAIEQEHTDHGRSAAMDASEAYLLAELRRLGFDGYDAFMRVALVAEVTARRDALATGGAGVASTARRGSALGRDLEAIMSDIARYEQLNEQLDQASGVLVDIAEEGKLLALNAVLASRRLGAGGETLTAVAHALQEAFPVMAHDAFEVIGNMVHARTSLAEAGFAIALAVLQNDMVDVFEHEHGVSAHDGDAGQLALLRSCRTADVAAMTAAIQDMLSSVHRTITATAELEQHLTLLATIERNGQVEASRLGQSGNLNALLDHVRARLRDALTHTRRIKALAFELDRLDTKVDSLKSVPAHA